MRGQTPAETRQSMRHVLATRRASLLLAMCSSAPRWTTRPWRALRSSAAAVACDDWSGWWLPVRLPLWLRQLPPSKPQGLCRAQCPHLRCAHVPVPALIDGCCQTAFYPFPVDSRPTRRTCLCLTQCQRQLCLRRLDAWAFGSTRCTPPCGGGGERPLHSGTWRCGDASPSARVLVGGAPRWCFHSWGSGRGVAAKPQRWHYCSRR